MTKMTARQVAQLAIRVLAIWTAVEAIKYFPGIGWALSLFDGIGSRWELAYWVQAILTVLVPLVLCGLALMLWKRAGVVAAVIVGHDLQDEQNEPDSSPQPASVAAIHAVVFSVLGAWVLVWSVPEVLHHVIYFVASVTSDSRGVESWFRNTNLLRLISDVLRCVLGIWLFLGANGIVSFLRRVRRIGLEPNENPSAGRHEEAQNE